MERLRLNDMDKSHPSVAQGIAAALNWHRSFVGGQRGTSLILAGSNGTGKTAIAKALLWTVCLMDGDVPVAPAGRFFVASELIADLEPKFSLAAEFDGAPIVVLDDLTPNQLQVLKFVTGQDQRGELQARIFKVVNWCYEHKISLIITTNVKINQLVDFLGPATWSRLQEMAPASQRYAILAPDWRTR